MKAHSKRLATPKTWPITRKSTVFVAHPRPSGHRRSFSMPVGMFLRDVLRVTKTAAESRVLLRAGAVLLDQRPVRDARRPAGLMDTLVFSQNNTAFRVTVTLHGKLALVPITVDEAAQKICRVVGKQTLKGGKTQVHLHDGRSVVTEKVVAVGDSLLIKLPSQEIVSILKLEKGVLVLMIEGTHHGHLGKVAELRGRKIMLSIGDETFETVQDSLIVLGKDKPECTVTQDGQQHA